MLIILDNSIRKQIVSQEKNQNYDSNYNTYILLFITNIFVILV